MISQINSNATIKKLLNSGLFLYFLYCLLTWTAFYIKMPQFGLYEDDYWFVGIPATMSFNELLGFIKEMLTNLERGQGRFIGSSLPLLLAYVNFHLGGLFLAYFFGILLVGLNAYLLYKAVSKRFNKIISVTAGIVFVLFPGDTTKAMLVHIYQLQLSIFFILLAFNFYLSERKFIAYVFALFCLLTYESPFLPFIFAPLLMNLNWKTKTLFRFIKHNLILAGFIIIMFIFRKLTGEERVAELVIQDFLIKTAASFLIGPVFSLISFFNALYLTIVNLHETYITIVFSLFIFALFAILIKELNFDPSKEKYQFNHAFLKYNLELPKEVDKSLKLVLVSVLMTVIAYSFSVTHFPPVTLEGRATSVHLGASIGISLLIAAFLNLIIFLIQHFRYRRIVYGVVIVCLSLITGYGMLIQNDYVLNWEKQKLFWSKVLEHAPDLEENTHILVEMDNIYETTYAYTYSWSKPMVLSQLFHFPEDWYSHPKLTILDLHMEKGLTASQNGEICFRPSYPFLYNFEEKVTLPQHNVILLRVNENNQFERITGIYQVDSSQLYLKEKTEDKIKNYKPTKLYPYFFENQ